MTPEQKSFAEKWHYKIVKPIGKYQIPNKEYAVTSALLNWEDEDTIFAVKALDYSLENKHWFTLKLSPAEVEALDQDFEVVRDGVEELKPKILHEAVLIWHEKKDGKWHLYTRSLVSKDSALQYSEAVHATIDESSISRIKAPCVEYMFIYKSIFDTDRPSCYIVNVEVDESNDKIKVFEDIFDFVTPFRRDILDGKVIYGINTRLEAK